MDPQSATLARVGFLLLVCITVEACAPAAYAAEANPDPGLTDASGFLRRDELVAAVIERNPSIDAARYAWKAAFARAAQVTLQYPRFSYELAPLSVGSSKVDFGENAELSQALPWPGKLRRQREAAAHEAESAFQDLEEAKIEMALAASDLFDDDYLAARALQINAQHVRLLEELKRAATGQYAAGRGAQMDPLNAEVELAHLEHRDVVLRAERRIIAARLNALLHRSPTAALPEPPPQLSSMADADRILQLDEAQVERLEDRALANRPELAAATAEANARRAEVAGAHLEGYPDFEIMGSYNSMWGDEEHRWMTGIAVTLPLWRGRIKAAQAESEARSFAADRKRQALEAEVRSTVRLTYDRALETHHVAELFVNRLLPAGRDQLRAARSGLESGTGNFTSLINAERNLRDVELGYEEALTNVDRRLAELARQLGCLPGELMDVVSDVVAGNHIPKEDSK